MQSQAQICLLARKRMPTANCTGQTKASTHYFCFVHRHSIYYDRHKVIRHSIVLVQIALSQVAVKQRRCRDSMVAKAYSLTIFLSRPSGLPVSVRCASMCIAKSLIYLLMFCSFHFKTGALKCH